MDRKTLNKRIQEILGDKKVTNISEAREYFKNKDIKEIAEEINKKDK